jgi:hypothetical protein
MKLLQELLSLREEEMETKLASDVWKDSKESANEYVTNVTYEAREIPDSNPTKYEVYTVKGKTRKLVGKFSTEDFEAAYVEVRKDQEEDVEGYKTYRDAGDIEALQYDGDTITLDLETDEMVKLEKGDYLIRQAEGTNFTYAVETTKDFEDDYVEQK